MTFLLPIMLIGLAAVALPVLIHILNRSKAERVRWGAMQFLLASVASQQRRILVEEMILLALRCVMLALIALAMARPFLPSRAGVPWLLVLPAAIGAAVCTGVGAAMWSYRKARRTMFIVAASLILLAAAGAALEKWLQAGWWSSDGGDRDIVVLIDSSGSMTLLRDGKSNFEYAIDEARDIVKNAQPGDAISLILCGPVPVPLVFKPTSDRKELLRQLDPATLHPSGGPLGVLEAFNAASRALALGPGAEKKIVMISDGQAVGWNLDGEARWRFLSDGLKALPKAPRLVYRRLPMPEPIRNVGLADLAFARKIVDVSRPVDIDVRIVNPASVPMRPEGVTLAVDGTPVDTQAFGREIMPGSAESVRFVHHFEQAGRHVVTATLQGSDDLSVDQSVVRVADVVERLPVAIVDGSPSTKPLAGASGFIEVALNPSYEKETSLMERIRSMLRRDEAASKAETSTNAVRNLVVPDIIPVSALDKLQDLAAYRVIILANVPRLPSTLTDRLTEFVQGGGGLLIVPGDGIVPEAYNDWKTPAGEPILPARIVERAIDADTPVQFDLPSFSHPALGLVADEDRSDIDAALVKAHWRLAADQADAAVRVGGKLKNGDPYLVEREFGAGYIVMLALALDRTDSNLASLKSFVPLVHELVYYLAAPMIVNHNVTPGAEFTLALTADDARKRGHQAARPTPAVGAAASDTNAVRVRLPVGGERPASVEPTARGMRLTFAGTTAPGLYEFLVPTNVAALYSTNLLGAVSIPFCVIDDGTESNLEPLPADAFERLRDYVDILDASQTADVDAAMKNETPGDELWRYLVIGALLALLGELFVSRWIAVKRRYHTDDTVQFGGGVMDVRAFRDRARQLLGTADRPPAPAAAGQETAAR